MKKKRICILIAHCGFEEINEDKRGRTLCLANIEFKVYGLNS